MQLSNNELFSNLKSFGANLIGFADLQEIASDIRNGYRFGISIAVALDPIIVAGIINGPNQLYYKEYKRVNDLLDTIGQNIVIFLQEKGQIRSQSPG